MVLRNVDEAFPLVFRDWSAKARMGLGSEGLLGPGLDSEITSRISGILARIDHASSSLQQRVRMLYEAYAADPCEKGAACWLRSMVEKVNEADFALRKLLIIYSNLRNVRTSEAREALERAEAAFEESDPVDSVRRAFRRDKGNVSEWTQME